MTMYRRSFALAAVAASVMMIYPLHADAGRVDIDVNAVPMRSIGTFTADYTGRLLLGGIVFHPDLAEDTEVVAIAVDGQNRLPAPKMATLEGYIDLAAGKVTGGLLKLFLLKSRDDEPAPELDHYVADVRADSGQVVQAIGSAGLYQLGGLTVRSEFLDGDGDGLFGGVDLGDIAFGDDDGSLGTLPGNFLVLDYRPNADGADIADIEIRAVPLPAAALLAGPLVLGLPLLRRSTRG